MYAAAAAAKSLQSCLTLCDPTDSSSPGMSYIYIYIYTHSHTCVCVCVCVCSTSTHKLAFHQFGSVAQLCPTLCDPIDCSTPGSPVHHQLPEPAQTHVHQVSDAIQPSHPLSPPSPPAFNLLPASGSFLMSQFFTSGGQTIGASASTSVLSMNIQD